MVCVLYSLILPCYLDRLRQIFEVPFLFKVFLEGGGPSQWELDHHRCQVLVTFKAFLEVGGLNHKELENHHQRAVQDLLALLEAVVSRRAEASAYLH